MKKGSKITAVFDIGKTNKKFFLFDKDFQEVYKEYTRFDEIKDEDGHPTDNLAAIQGWAKTLFARILESDKFDVGSINFSSYGASLVHLDKHGKVLTPLYNYTKALPQETLDLFLDKYGSEIYNAASPDLGMLSSGLQLFWIKYAKPDIYKKISYSLHLPQYLSYLFTGIPLSDYTSIGCHTMLWNYEKDDYHDWVYQEEIDLKLAPLVSSDTSINMNYEGKRIQVGVGIHDSSAALIPYLKGDKKPFLLLSTGTWSVVLNPFTNDVVSKGDLYYMDLNGRGVKANKVFLGNEYKLQVKELQTFYKVKADAHKKLKFSSEIYNQIKADHKLKFRFQSLDKRAGEPKQTRFNKMQTFEKAYHQLMIELMELQVALINESVGSSKIKKLYIDGGFIDNDIFVKLLSFHFKNYKLRTTETPLGSALGAALVIDDQKLGKRFLKDKYHLKKHKPFVINKA